MFEDLEKNWAEEDKDNDYVRDRIVRQLIGLAIVLVALAAIALWYYIRNHL